jgi:hypothetical protein
MIKLKLSDFIFISISIIIIILLINNLIPNSNNSNETLENFSSDIWVVDP